MDRSEPSLVPEWLKGTSGGSASSGHHIFSATPSGLALDFKLDGVPVFISTQIRFKLIATCLNNISFLGNC